MAIITNLRKWRNGEVINARDYVYERDLIVSLVNEHDEKIVVLENLIGIGETGAEYIRFDINSTQDMEALPNGSVFYNPDKRTLSYKCEFGHIHNINQEVQEIGKNDSGLSLVEGTVVSWAGAQGANKLFTRADASDPTKSQLVGVLHHPAGVNGFAPVAVFAEIEINDFRQIMETGSDTGLVEGTKLYLSYTIPGRYTLTPPPRPYADIWVASVVSINLSSHKGKIFVYPQNQRVEGGIWIEVSENEPIGQVEGDFWYSLSEGATPPVIVYNTISGGDFTTTSFTNTLSGGTFTETPVNIIIGGNF